MEKLKPFKMFEKQEWIVPDLAKMISKIFEKTPKNKNIEKLRNKFIDALVEYQDGICELIDFGNISEVDIKVDIKSIKKVIDPITDRVLGVTEFLRMFNNLIRVPKKNLISKIEKLFETYIDTLPNRFNNLLDVTKGKKLGEYEDKLEGDDDKSVLDRGEYEQELYELQIQLSRFQKWVVKNNKRVALVFEGRDAAGKGSAIKRFIQYLPVNGYRIVTLGVPSKSEMKGDNWFKRYEALMPKEGEIVFFDRSWYGMALVNPTMGYCSEEQYKYFMENVNDFENRLSSEGVDLIKFWFSITQEKQLQRFKLRQDSELKYWKFSPNDLKSIDKWDVFTNFKEQCFNKTSTYDHPWVIVNSNDKKLARLNSIRYVLSKFNFPGKDKDSVNYYPEIVYELK